MFDVEAASKSSNIGCEYQVYHVSIAVRLSSIRVLDTSEGHLSSTMLTAVCSTDCKIVQNIGQTTVDPSVSRWEDRFSFRAHSDGSFSCCFR